MKNVKNDIISRQAAIEAECKVCQIAPKRDRGHNCPYYVHGCKEIECLRDLPSAQPERYMVKMDEPSDIEILKGILSKPSDIVFIPMTKAETPRKKGKWMHKHKIYGVTYCSECDYELHTDNTSFCPNCGADMRGEEDG